MTDLDLVKACAEAMELPRRYEKDRVWILGGAVEIEYDPLHDDAQAMALVKKFRLQILQGDVYDTKELVWIVSSGEGGSAVDSDLNRAIVECVAKLKV